jgi:hypothetical protein
MTTTTTTTSIQLYDGKSTFLELWMKLFLGALQGPVNHNFTTRISYTPPASCSEMKAGEWLYFCVAHGIDGAMEVCFVKIVTARRLNKSQLEQ